MMRSSALALLLVANAAAPDLKEDALQALKKAATFYRTQVASHGGYVYYTSADLKDRWGEGKATPQQVFVQPPGTPTVGLAYLKAWRATGDAYYLDAAREAAEALVYGQLESGGWQQVVDFDPQGKNAGRYRKGRGGGRNISSLDDGQTSSALRLLIRADEALGFKNADIHEAALYGLQALLKAQFPNGAFPQVWAGPVEAKPVVKAGYPEYDWKTEGRVKNYWDLYTLNDCISGYVFETLAEAHRAYKDEKYKAGLEKLGDFLLLAQMPDPQPAWAQQYTYEMRPAWARKFEPPAVTSWESQDVMETLIRISLFTGKKKYLEPIPAALEYLKKSLLPDGKLARFYELRTNKPLYMDGKYQLTYDDSAAPSHYGWKQESRLDRIEKALRAAQGGTESPGLDAGLRSKEGIVRPAGQTPEEMVRKVVASLDGEGRWVSAYAGERLVGQPKFAAGFQYLHSGVFSGNVEALSDFLSSSRK
jgi:PelA/Pel-15E family pectate lyase